MNKIKKLSNLTPKKKILIMVATIALIALFNFLFYNYQVLKLPADKRIQTLDISKLTTTGFKIKDEKLYTTEKNASLDLNMDSQYVREVIINYETKDHFNVVYNGEFANYYGILKNKQETDTCYSFLGVCGVNLNQKIGRLKLTLNQEDIVISEIKIKSNLYFNWTTFSFWTIGIGLLMLLYFEKDFFLNKKHYLSFILCIGFGTILLLSTHNMTTTTLDDETHYKMSNSFIQSTNQISVSDYYLQNCLVPFASQDTIEEREAFQKFINDSSDKFISSPTTAENLLVTNKINYIPMALTMKILNMLNCSQTTCFYVARIVQLLIYSIVIACAVKLIPTHKMLMLLIGILPQSLFLATNFSYDPTVTAFSMLSFAAFANEYYHKERPVQIKNVLIFIFAGLYGVFPKAIYAPFLLLMLLLPENKFKNKKQYKTFRLLIISIFLISVASFVIPLLTEPATRSDYRGGDTSAVRQIKMILHAPLSFIKTFWYGAILNTPENLFGPRTLGLLSYYGSMAWDSSYFLWIIATILAFLEDSEYQETKIQHKIFMTIIYGFIICAIWGSMYLIFTPVGEDVINGVQPRYFIPLIFPILYLFANSKLKNKLRPMTTMIICTSFCIIANLLLIYQIIIKMYCL